MQHWLNITTNITSASVTLFFVVVGGFSGLKFVGKLPFILLATSCSWLSTEKSRLKTGIMFIDADSSYLCTFIFPTRSRMSVKL